MTGGFIETDMPLLHSLLSKLGLSKVKAERHPIRVFLLDDDKRRHRWFSARFKGDFVDVANDVKQEGGSSPTVREGSIAASNKN